MNRGIWADPKFEKGHLAEPPMETDEMVGPGCKHLANEHPHAKKATVRTGTVSHSPLKPFGQLEHHLGATAIHGSPLMARADPKAPITHIEAPSDPRPWPYDGQMAHLEEGDPTCDLPSAAHGRAGLTPDNLHLTETKTVSLLPVGAEHFAINCTADLFLSDRPNCLSDAANDLLRHSLSDNTERALRGDLAQFQDWGGSLPATPATVCAYIGDHAGQHAVATIQRRVASISKAHEMAGLPNPCRAEIVKATLSGLRRKRGTAQRQAKALLRDDLLLVLDRLGETLRDQRDRALLLLGFAGGFRRSELVALEHADIEPARQGLIVTIRRSKTDQEGAGRRIGIPHGRTRHCPVSAVEAWLGASSIVSGPVFRPINRHGHVDANPLTGDAVSVLLRERLQRAGIDPDGYSGHSLRAGFATSAAQAGVSTLKIRQQTGHASDAMLARYVREGELFTGNAAGVLL